MPIEWAATDAAWAAVGLLVARETRRGDDGRGERTGRRRRSGPGHGDLSRPRAPGACLDGEGGH
jgi:hypothetical protein